MVANLSDRFSAWKAEASDFFRGSMRSHRIAFGYAPLVVLGSIGLSILSSLAGFLIVWASALLIDELVTIAGGGGVSSAFPYIIALAIFSVVLPDAIGTLREFIERAHWLRVSTALEVHVLRARFRVEVATHESPAYQDTHAKATDRGIYPIVNLLDMQYAMIADVLSLLIAATILWRIHPFYVALLILGVVPRLIVGVLYGKSVWTMYDMNAEERRKFYFLRGFPDSTNWLMEAHLLGISGTLVGRMQGLADRFLGYQLAIERKKVIWGIFATGVLVAVYASVYGHILSLVIAGTLTIGGFIFATGAFARFAEPLQRIFLGVGRQYEFWLFAREIFRIMDLVPTIPPPAVPQSIDLSAPVHICFEHVSFRYPHARNFALTDVSFTIAPGTSFALVGLNGAGKTTLVKLLCRFYDPTEGRILVNGIDLREIDLASWYQALAVLFQHFPTYESFTVREGIALGDVSVPLDQSRILRATDLSGASEFIDAWPATFDQMIGKQFEGGTEPSRGQEQRLALARMFYRGARCLLLDEPTAAVDAESEAKIFSAIEEMEGTTRVMISHRFSTVRHADQICVIKDGSIIELGTHTELMKRDGEYARLFRLQAKGYQDTETD